MVLQVLVVGETDVLNTHAQYLFFGSSLSIMQNLTPVASIQLAVLLETKIVCQSHEIWQMAS